MWNAISTARQLVGEGMPQSPQERDKVDEILGLLEKSPSFKAALDSSCLDAAKRYSVPMAMITFGQGSDSTVASQLGLHSMGVTTSDGGSGRRLGQTVRRKLPTIVLDASIDERFSHDHLVTGTCGVRMYAAAPLRWHDTVYVGSLCVLDTKPWAELSLQDCDSLCAVADHVITVCKQLMLAQRSPPPLPYTPSPEVTGGSLLGCAEQVASGFSLESRACP